MVHKTLAFLQRPITRAESLGLYVAIFVATAIGISQVIGAIHGTHALATRVARDEAATHQSAQKSCRVQSVDLRAQNYLTGILADAHDLFKLPKTAASKQEQKSLTPAMRRYAIKTMKSMDHDLGAYVKLENSQPNSRTCG